MISRLASAACLLFAFILVAAGLVFYSQTWAFAWDEGFHLLAAQLIKHGRKPYIDFVFSQAPLNAWWNAFWMSLFGESWRPPHAIAALCSAGAVALTSGYVFARFPVPPWRFPGALLAVVMVGLNVLVVRYGGLAQPYGLCLLAIVAAYRLAIAAATRNGITVGAIAGLCCGLAAGSSLLTAPVGPVLLLWLFLYNGAGRRIAKCLAFIAAEALAFVPVVWLGVLGPRQVWFGIVDYNLLYRQLDWPDATRQNLEVLTSWINSGQAVILILLAVGGLLFIRSQSQWEARSKAEFYLCAWLSVALVTYISNVRPTFERYYIFAVPFVGILAVAGVTALASKLYRPDAPLIPALMSALLLSLSLGVSLYNERDSMRWTDMEKVAMKVKEVTAADQALFGDEETYFLSHHSPPSGMEMQNSHKFNFPRAMLSKLHLIPQAQLDGMVKEGFFHTLETCDSQESIEAHGYAGFFASRAKAGECQVFWDYRRN